MSHMTLNELIGTTEAARILGLSRNGLNRRVTAGLICPIGEIGKRGIRVYRRAEIEALAAKENDQ